MFKMPVRGAAFECVTDKRMLGTTISLSILHVTCAAANSIPAWISLRLARERVAVSSAARTWSDQRRVVGVQLLLPFRVACEWVPVSSNAIYEGSEYSQYTTFISLLVI